MNEDWLYFNQETSRMYGNNKWFQLLCILPPEAIRGDNNNIDRIRFALLNEETLNKTAKKAIFKYVYSNALNYWSIYMERNQLGFFDDPDRIKWPKRIKETTMIAIQKLCRYHNNEQYQLWDAKCKKQYETERVQFYKQQKKEQDFLESPLYQFIQQLTYKEGDIITSKNFYEKYCKFCKTNKLQTVSQDSFGRMLSNYKIVPFRHKMIRSYRMERDSIEKFINFYGQQPFDPSKLSPQEAQARKERMKIHKQELIKMDKMAAFSFCSESESDSE